jgi:hypothetical protein
MIAIETIIGAIGGQNMTRAGKEVPPQECGSSTAARYGQKRRFPGCITGAS